MDAVMVVHQLQRLATASPPSASLTAKLPRVAVGICYFIDHPEVGVRQQAAAAVKAVTLKHHKILRNTCCGSSTGLTHTAGSLSCSSTDTVASHDSPHNSSSNSCIEEPDSGKQEGNGSSNDHDKNQKDGISYSTDSDRNCAKGNDSTGASEQKKGEEPLTTNKSSPKTEKNLVTLLQRHINSEDIFVRDCCRAALQALLQQPESTPTEEQIPSAALDTKPHLHVTRLSPTHSATAQPSAASPYAETHSAAAPSPAGQHPPKTRRPPAGAAQHPVTAQPSSTDSSAAFFSKQTNISSPASRNTAAVTPIDVGIDGIASSEKQQATAESVSLFTEIGFQEQTCPQQKQHSHTDMERPVSGNADSTRAHISASRSMQNSIWEGELCTVLLGLRGLLRQHQCLQQQQEADPIFAVVGGSVVSEASSGGHLLKSLEKLRRDLQYKLVRVPGVSSVTVTLNTRYLEQQLLLEEKKREEKRLQKEQQECSSNSSDKSENASCPQRQERETEPKKNGTEDEREEGDGVAVLLMRLPSPPKKRFRALQAVKEVCGPLTLVLRATRVYEHRKATSRHSSTGYVAAGGKKTERGRAPTTPVRKQEEQEDARRKEEGQKDDAEESTLRHGRDGAAAAASPAQLAAANIQYLDDEQQSSQPTKDDSRFSSREEKNEDLGYFQRQPGAPNEKSHASGDTSEEGFCGWGPTAAGFSFFSRNSALFSQSRHLNSCLLPYEEDERHIAERLKKEKALKQHAQRQQAKRETVVDRVLSNIGKGLFW